MSKEGVFSINMTDEFKHICCVQSIAFEHLLGVLYLAIGVLLSHVRRAQSQFERAVFQ